MLETLKSVLGISDSPQPDVDHSVGKAIAARLYKGVVSPFVDSKQTAGADKPLSGPLDEPLRGARPKGPSSPQTASVDPSTKLKEPIKRPPKAPKDPKDPKQTKDVKK